MDDAMLADKIQILIEAAWQCGFYTGAMGHGNMIQTEKERYQRLLKDALDKRSMARCNLLDFIKKNANIPYEILNNGHEVHRL